MKLLLDTCVSRHARVMLARSHDVVWSAEWPKDPGDVEILALALREGRVLVTLDKDFAELAVVRALPHAGILRLVGFRARSQGPACEAALVRYGAELDQRAIVTVEPTRVRVRPAEPRA